MWTAQLGYLQPFERFIALVQLGVRIDLGEMGSLCVCVALGIRSGICSFRYRARMKLLCAVNIETLHKRRSLTPCNLGAPASFLEEETQSQRNTIKIYTIAKS